MVYSIAERIEIIEIVYENSRCANKTTQVFNQHQNKHVNRKHVLDLMNKFWETIYAEQKAAGPKLDSKKEGMEIAILSYIAIERTLCSKQLKIVSGINWTDIQSIWTPHKFHPYEIQLVKMIIMDACSFVVKSLAEL